MQAALGIVLLLGAAALQGAAPPAQPSSSIAPTAAAYAQRLEEIDLEMAHALADLAEAPDPESREALAALR